MRNESDILILELLFNEVLEIHKGRYLDWQFDGLAVRNENQIGGESFGGFERLQFLGGLENILRMESLTQQID